MADAALEYMHELSSWKDSPAIIELRGVLKAFQAEFGCLLVINGSCPTLRFNPPLSMDDPPERWDFANYAVTLALNARRDLMELIRAGRLRLPVVS